jgi:hypothetical protein
MSKSQIESSGLFLAVLGALVVLSLFLTDAYAWLGSICGFSLVLILLGYDREGYRTVFESLAFSAVFSLALTIAIATPLRMFVGSMSEPAEFLGRVSNQWMPLIWVFVTAVFCPIDRARMSGRVAPVATAPSAAAPTLFVPAPTSATPELPRAVLREPVPTPAVHLAPAAHPAPAVYPAPAPQPPARATFTRPAFSGPAPAAVAAPPAPASAGASVIASPQPVPAQMPAPAPANIAPQPQPQPAPQVAPIPAGKEATIYVTLVGEGLNVLRAVRAEHLGRDFYRIVEEMPEGETWQWGPGQVVRCKKKTLSSGKAMVAFEEAQRAR